MDNAEKIKKAVKLLKEVRASFSGDAENFNSFSMMFYSMHNVFKKAGIDVDVSDGNKDE